MSTKRKNPTSKKNRAKSKKVEYDEEDISSEHDSDVDDAETGSNADGEDAAEDDLTDVSSIPELPPPEVILLLTFSHACLSQVESILRSEGSKNNVGVYNGHGFHSQAFPKLVNKIISEDRALLFILLMYFAVKSSIKKLMHIFLISFCA